MISRSQGFASNSSMQRAALRAAADAERYEDEGVKLERLDYFWGLFEHADQAGPATPAKHLSLTGAEIPREVQESFAAERIHELRGEFGLPGAGEPEEVSFLDATAGAERWQIRVLNHGIAMFHAESPELTRLFRFFCILGKEADRRKAAPR